MKHYSGKSSSLQCVGITEVIVGESYPKLTKAVRRCPAEDVGRPWEYEKFKEVMSDLGHPEYEEMMQWFEERNPGSFDPNDPRLSYLEGEIGRVREEIKKQH